MRYGSVCSGVEAATVAWHPLGWSPQWFAEVDAFPSAVLAHRFPAVPNIGDMTKVIGHELTADIDLLVGGTPCQSFSIAGLRKGLDDERGNLALEFCRIAAAKRPRWIVWENVPGVLSSDGGRAFGSILGALADLGYRLAWRVLDAQHFGVAQRRRRVFLVGYLGGSGNRAAEVLFEPEGVPGNPPSREKAWEELAADPSCRPDRRGVRVAAWDPNQITSKTNRSRVELGRPCHTIPAAPRAPSVVLPEKNLAMCMTTRWGSGHNDPFTETYLSVPADGYNHTINKGGVAATVSTDTHHNTNLLLERVAFHATQDPISGPVSPCLGANMRVGVTQRPPYRVRRLTPVECERLQGFPDRWTAIPFKGKPVATDGHRYKAMGNSMAVPVMRWIGERIQLVGGGRS